MKVLTLNFLTCAVKACKSSSASFPLHPKDAELVSEDLPTNAKLLANLLPRLDWEALSTISAELGLPALPPNAPAPEDLATDEQLLKDLHVLLMETQISAGKLVCANCGHEYVVREGVANFLLPDHLV
ncbi:hypothetical protein V500_06406 [Pseudogymnoascus sp. VKM F-4518 (FW-2643)]|nr:hypothetical protein V500_06406 [Pseudogymnoascus sp. VKM F-4518 (FW-2643)]